MVARWIRQWPLVLAGAALLPSTAAAHGRLSGDTVYIDATPSTRAFAKLDDDRDGLMRGDEVKRHREELLSFFDNAFRVFDEHGQRGQRIFADLSTPHAHDDSLPQGAEHLRFTFRYRFAAEPRKLRVQWFEAKQEPLKVQAVRSVASKLIHEQTPVGAEESVTLTELQPAAFLLALPAPLEAETHGVPHPIEPVGASSTLRLKVILLSAGAVLVGALAWAWLKRRRAKSA